MSGFPDPNPNPPPSCFKLHFLWCDDGLTSRCHHRMLLCELANRSHHSLTTLNCRQEHCGLSRYCTVTITEHKTLACLHKNPWMIRNTQKSLSPLGPPKKSGAPLHEGGNLQVFSHFAGILHLHLWSSVYAPIRKQGVCSSRHLGCTVLPIVFLRGWAEVLGSCLIQTHIVSLLLRKEELDFGRPCKLCWCVSTNTSGGGYQK